MQSAALGQRIATSIISFRNRATPPSSHLHDRIYLYVSHCFMTRNLPTIGQRKKEPINRSSFVTYPALHNHRAAKSPQSLSHTLFQSCCLGSLTPSLARAWARCPHSSTSFVQPLTWGTRTASVPYETPPQPSGAAQCLTSGRRPRPSQSFRYFGTSRRTKHSQCPRSRADGSGSTHTYSAPRQGPFTALRGNI